MSAIPSQAQYALKPNTVKIERRQQVIPSLNKRSYAMGTASGDTVIFYLPSLANAVVDGQSAYLRFNIRVQNAAGGGAARSFHLDHGAWSVINSLRVYGAGGSLCEEILDYNVLYNALIDAMVHQSEKIAQSSTWGTEEGYGTVTSAVTTSSSTGGARAITTTNTGGGALAQLVSGDGTAGQGGNVIATSTVVNSNRQGFASGAIADGTTAEFSFSIPILSSLFSLSEKMLPVYALNDDTRLEFQLENVQRAFVSATMAGTTVTIENPELVCDYLFLQPETLSTIQSFYAGRDLVLNTTSYHSYQSTLPTGTQGNAQAIIPSKVVSAKMLLGVFRPQNHVNAQTAYSLSSRVNPMHDTNSRFSLNIGGVIVPQHGIQTYTASQYDMFYSELQKAFHALGMMTCDGSLPRSYYNVNAVGVGAAAPAPGDGATSFRNGFLLGLNLDSIVRSSESAMSGMDLSRVTSYANYRITTATALDLVVNYFILHDQLLVIDQSGAMTARF